MSSDKSENKPENEVPSVKAGNDINVEEIMSEIRETIAKKKEMGIYSDEEIEEISQLKLETYADSAEIDTHLLSYLRDENRLWNISSDYAKISRIFLILRVRDQW